MSAQNLIPGNPELRDALDIAKRELSLSLFCHHIGIIQEFDKVKQTATVTIAYKKTFLKPNDDGVYEPVNVDYPALPDCPVVFLGGGTGRLTFPVTKGDECLVIFNDRDLDNWFQGNQGAEVATARLHAITDAIVLVGVRSTPNAIPEFDEDRALLQKGVAKVGAGKDDDKVLIAGGTATPTTLNTELQNLITQITTLNGYLQTLVAQTALITVTGVTTGAAASGPPANAPAITAVSGQIGGVTTALGNIATALGGFLE